MVTARFLEKAAYIETPAGHIPVGAYRVTGSYLRPFTVWVGAETVYYSKYTVAGRALVANANQERHWLGQALVSAGAPTPLAYVGV